ncbi:MAG: hypothetical protein HZA89_11725 [Verrucomicrobia bacterium]|nr:hypothetical protein [Verrucomicrobiota bacterium]
MAAVPAFACDLCSVYSAATARGELGRGFHVSLAEQFTHQGTLQMDSVRTTSPVPQSLDGSTAQLVLGCNFNDRVGLQLNVPVIHRSFQRPDDTGALQRGSVSGLGDISLVANVSAFRRDEKHYTFHWGLLAGLKLPTGSASRLQEEVDELTAPPAPVDSAIHGHDLALGSGSVDGLLGTSIYARWERLFFAAGTQFAWRSKGRFDYKFANDLMWSGGPGALLVPGDDFTLALQANISGETKGQDTFMGARAEDSGVTTVYAGPQVSVTWKEKFSAEVGVDLPVSLRNTALQIVPDYRIRAALTWRF